MRAVDSAHRAWGLRLRNLGVCGRGRRLLREKFTLAAYAYGIGVFVWTTNGLEFTGGNPQPRLVGLTQLLQQRFLLWAQGVHVRKLNRSLGIKVSAGRSPGLRMITGHPGSHRFFRFTGLFSAGGRDLVLPCQPRASTRCCMCNHPARCCRASSATVLILFPSTCATMAKRSCNSGGMRKLNLPE